MTRFGFFGPSERNDVPEGGFCISAFAIMKKRGKVLAIKPRAHVRWEEEWAPNWRVYDAAGLKAELEKWRLPSTYMKEGEGPEQALSRIMLDQLGVKVYSVRLSSLQNFYEPSRRYPGKMHWDYCFVFNVSTHEEVKESPWLSNPRYVKASDQNMEFGSAQGGLLARLKLL